MLRNSISVLNNAAINIHNFVTENNMKLNTTKCKEMLKPGFHMSPMIGLSLSVIIQGENLQRILLKINHRQWTSLMSPAYENYRLHRLLRHPNFLFKPTQIGSYVVEQLNTYKI